MIEQREYEAFRAFPAVAGTVSPTRPIDVTTGHARVTLQGTGFSVRIQISNAQPGRGDQPHLFLPPEASFETFQTVTPDDPPTMIPAPVRWLRLIVDAGVITGGNVAESSRTGAEINERLLADIAQNTELMQQAAGVGRVATEADLTGQPGTPEKPVAYELTATNERLLWNGTGIVPGSRGPMLVDVNAQKRIAVDATLYGVAEGAPAQTLMDAIAATPDGGTLVCPRVTLKHATRTNMWIINRKNLTILGNGLRVEADANMPDEIGTYDTAHPDWGNPYTGGFKIAYSENVFIHEIEYDGRLDARTPHLSDASGSGPRSAWNILDRCVNVQLIDCKGTRGMMDGVCVGPTEKMFLLKQGIPDYGDIVPERDLPRKCLLKNFVAEYNYRQGLSGVGHYDLTIDGGRYAWTGRLPDGADGHKKWTLPCAGIDLEAFFVFGWLCERTKIINRPEITENRGIGLLIENGTRHSQIDVWSHHNWGEGVAENGVSGTMDNYVDGVFEYNCNNPAPDGWRNAEVARSGIRPVQRGVIRANRHNGGLAISQPCLDPDVQGVNITATDPRPGERCGMSSVTTGGETAIDTTTGTFYGYVPGTTTDEHIRKPVPQSGGIIMGNTVVNGTWVDSYYPAFGINAPGARVIGNEARKTVSADLGSKIGVDIYAAAYASGNSGPGYARPVRSNAPGEHLERLPAPYFAVNKVDNLKLSGYTAADYNKKVTLLSDDPDVLRYEVEWTVIYDAQDADREAQFDLLPSRLEGIKWTAVSVSATAPYAVGAWRQGNAALIVVSVPRTFSGITIRVIVEVRRA